MKKIIICYFCHVYTSWLYIFNCAKLEKLCRSRWNQHFLTLRSLILCAVSNIFRLLCVRQRQVRVHTQERWEETECKLTSEPHNLREWLWGWGGRQTFCKDRVWGTPTCPFHSALHLRVPLLTAGSPPDFYLYLRYFFNFNWVIIFQFSVYSWYVHC